MKKLKWRPTIELKELSHLINVKVHIEEWINVLQFLVGCFSISSTCCTVVVKKCTYQSTTEESTLSGYLLIMYIKNKW